MVLSYCHPCESRDLKVHFKKLFFFMDSRLRGNDTVYSYDLYH